MERNGWAETFLKVFTVFQASRVEFMMAGGRLEAGKATLAPPAHKTGSVYVMPASAEGALNDLCLKDFFFFWLTKILLLQ